MAEIITIPEGSLFQEIDINIQEKTSIPSVYAKQYDTGKYIIATLWDKGVPYRILPTDTIYFAGTKVGEKGILKSSLDEGILLGIDSEGRIIYKIDANDTATTSNYDAEFRVLDVDNNLKSTPKFRMFIEKSALQDDTQIVIENGTVTMSLLDATNNANKAYKDYQDATKENTDVAIINLRQQMIYIDDVEDTTLIPLDAELLNGYDSSHYAKTSDLNNKIKIYTFTATSTVSSITHNLNYIPTTDDIIIIYNGVLLEENDNYSNSSDYKSIILNGWTINSGEKIAFRLYKNVK